MTSVVLGPYACQMLGDLGADVVKIEPLAGDTNRNLGPHFNDPKMSALFLTCNRNKRSVALDLKSTVGREAALKLIATADVVVHNFRPQAMERLGLDYEKVKAVNPSVVYCATYGYSKKGPYGDKGALDDSIQAASGIAVLQSMVEGEPRYLPTIIADKTTGLMVVQSVLAALFHRERTGEGQAIEVPMFESMVSFVMTEHLWGHLLERRERLMQLLWPELFLVNNLSLTTLCFIALAILMHRWSWTRICQDLLKLMRGLISRSHAHRGPLREL